MAFTRREIISSLAGGVFLGGSVAVYRTWAQGNEHNEHHGRDMGTPGMAACSVPMDMATPGMLMGTPMASVDFDLMYIDMMIPHHESVIALAEVAVNEVEDARLVSIAQAILDTQPAEIEELRSLREEWYGDPEPAMMTENMMSMAMGMEHGGCAEQGHMDQMRGEWQLEQFAAADDKDMAFISQVIAHHRMAVQSSEMALEYAQHEEIRDIAQRVIDAQQVEIDELESIRDELQATPAA